ncbi:PAS domain-containing protein [Aeromicrobium sp.]|nr:PAS domain-containing protein [Candidatus Saccharibacteria bacterium]
MTEIPTDKIISCFYDSSEDCVKVVDPHGMLLSLNPNGLKVMEIADSRDVIGKDWLDFWQGNLQQPASAALKLASSGKMAKFEGFCPTFKGTMKYWEVSIAPLFSDYGDVQWLLVTSHDATPRIEMQKEILALRAEIAELNASK